MRCAQISGGLVTNIILADNPDDFNAVSCGDDVSVGWQFDDGEFSKPASVPPPYVPKSGADVNVERDRRIAAGTIITVAGYGDIPVTGSKDDKDVFLARRIRAREAETGGVTDPVFVFRDRSNNIHHLTPSQMVELCDKGIDWIEAMMIRSWEMKDGAAPYQAGIPDDLDNDSHWPTPA